MLMSQQPHIKHRHPLYTRSGKETPSTQDAQRWFWDSSSDWPILGSRETYGGGTKQRPTMYKRGSKFVQRRPAGNNNKKLSCRREAARCFMFVCSQLQHTYSAVFLLLVTAASDIKLLVHKILFCCLLLSLAVSAKTQMSCRTVHQNSSATSSWPSVATQ